MPGARELSPRHRDFGHVEVAVGEGISRRGIRGAPSLSGAALKQCFDGQADVAGNLAQQDRRDVAPLVEGNRRATSIRVAELLVRPSLPDFDEAESAKRRDDLAGLQDRMLGHG